MTPLPPGPVLDTARALVADRDLTGAAVGALTDIVRSLPLDSLGPVKQLLKRFFSDQPWTADDDDALADLVGTDPATPAVGELALDPELTLVWGWNDGRFRLRLRYAGAGAPPAVADDGTAESDLGYTFESDVFPEVTPSPRTIRFTTPPLHSGASKVYDSRGAAAGDARAERIFDEFKSVTNVLVGPDFVAVTIARPNDWESLLGPILRTVAEEFTGVAPATSAPAASDATMATDGTDADSVREPRRLERAWAELGALRADRPDDLDRILAASRATEAAHRQVAAALLADAPPEIAAAGWEQLLGDTSRSVRRSAIDAVVDAAREELRPLLERALADTDAWIRWKAVRGIAAIGTAPSGAAIDALANDPDFRVRLEAGRTRDGNPS